MNEREGVRLLKGKTIDLSPQNVQFHVIKKWKTRTDKEITWLDGSGPGVALVAGVKDMGDLLFLPDTPFFLL